ncbi:MAG: DUF4270 domain-containing protein [Bacteroidota bacterium]
MLLLLSGILFIISCKKEEDKNTVGSDVIGNRSGFDVRVDTFDVIAYSVKADSVTSTNLLPYYLLGKMNDPALGTTTANIITQFSVPLNDFSFTGTIDSVVLQLRYAGVKGIYGSNLIDQTIKVHELTEDLPVNTPSSSSSNKEFYSNRNYTFSATELGSFTGKFNLTDSVKITVGTIVYPYAPQIRIKLTDAAFIARLQAVNKISQTAFKQQFKGLVISAEQQTMNAGDGALASLFLTNKESIVAVYTHRVENGNTVIEKYDLPVYGEAQSRTNQYKHSGQPALQPANGGTHQVQNYLQAAAGIRTRILVPGLAQLAGDKPIAVNGAKIILTTEPSAAYEAPARLIPYGADENGSPVSIPDHNEYFGGVYNTNGTYSFNVNRYVQSILTTYNQQKKDVNYGFNIIISPYEELDLARRVILNTDNSNPADRKLKFILTYTVIK